jgi:hypothetical protein
VEEPSASKVVEQLSSASISKISPDAPGQHRHWLFVYTQNENYCPAYSYSKLGLPNWRRKTNSCIFEADWRHECINGLVCEIWIVTDIQARIDTHTTKKPLKLSGFVWFQSRFIRLSVSVTVSSVAT